MVNGEQQIVNEKTTTSFTINHVPFTIFFIMGNLKRALKVDWDEVRGRWYAVRLASLPLPRNVGTWLTPRLMRWAGFEIGHATLFSQLPTVTGTAEMYDNLKIGRNCYFNAGATFEAGGKITIGRSATVFVVGSY